MDMAAPSRADDATGGTGASGTNGVDSFAGVFAALMQAALPKPALPVPQADGTSELDQPELSEDAKADADAGSAGETVKAADAATVTLTSSMTSSTNDIIRSVAALDPQLQAKLARVISRVRQETGRDVKVAETYRSQSRQDVLYAQGRDTAGPVVTWTQSSKHSQGRAVDVMMDNGTAPSEAYTVLQRIATEEGLRTLGARDPGHLELRGTGPKANVDATPSIPAEPADASGPGQVSIARLAQVARVADVRTERPATVATVARVGPAEQAAQPGVVGAATASRSKHSETSDRGAQGDSRGYAAMGTNFTHREQPATAFPAQAVAPMTGADAVARAERSLSHITMSVDAGNGMTDRVHVAMRGSSLTATIDASDNRGAQAMSARGDELARALSRDGIELQELRVRTATDTGAVTAAASSQASHGSTDASAQSRFDRGQASQQQQDQQQQREQREQGGEREQGGRQRSQQERDSRQQQRQPRGEE
jgi:hypothetical protein